MKDILIVKQATLHDTAIIENIFEDAILWLKKSELENLWTVQNTRWSCLSTQYDISDFYIAYVNQEPAGCMALTDEDVIYWPEVSKGESLFLHKLAVKRQFAGKDLSRKMIDFVKQKVIEEKYKAIRLDCNYERSKLRKLYEKNGFAFVRNYENKDGYKLVLYECKIK